MRASILASLVSALLASTSLAHSDCTAVDNAVIQHEGISKGVEEVQSGSTAPLALMSILSREEPTINAASPPLHLQARNRVDPQQGQRRHCHHLPQRRFWHRAPPKQTVRPPPAPPPTTH